MANMEGLRIGVDARPALWPRTGIGTLCFNFVKLIQKIDPQNQYYFYFDADPSILEEEYGLSNCRFAPIRNKLLWANWFALAQAKKDKIDIYISFLEKEIPLLGFKPKVILWICDLIPLLLKSAFRNIFHRYYYLSLLHLAARKSTQIVTISENSKRDLQELLHVDGTKVQTIRLGVDIRPCNRDRSQRILEQYEIPPKYILAVGSTEPRKNNATLIKAFNQVASKYPYLHLVIAGRRWRNQAFDDALLSDRVIQTGYVSDDEMLHLYANAYMFVFPSLYEGFGLPILEAMAQGTPVIVSRTSSLPEVAGSAALYIDPHDAADIAQTIVRVLENPQLRQELVDSGKLRATMFNWEFTCKDVASTYARLLAGARKESKRAV